MFWSVWHLPFYFAGTFLMSWLGIKTRYSVLLAVVAHTSANMVSEWFEPEWLYFAEMVGGGLVLLPVFWWLLAKEGRRSTL